MLSVFFLAAENEILEETVDVRKFIPDTSRVPPGGRTGWKFFRVEEPVFVTQAHTDSSS